MSILTTVAFIQGVCHLNDLYVYGQRGQISRPLAPWGLWLSPLRRSWATRCRARRQRPLCLNPGKRFKSTIQFGYSVGENFGFGKCYNRSVAEKRRNRRFRFWLNRFGVQFQPRFACSMSYLRRKSSPVWGWDALQLGPCACIAPSRYLQLAATQPAARSLCLHLPSS
jgi:hypothetical protein